ncbi:toxin-antitoxin system HicB family antitoxin [Tolypothrix sp. PCC 7910]|uniref:type II toxin-antitoxin system HicB family antitoxin n=1 Tax=Tolypothrix sp. PCC 7910 TaxID=2099387 RepID=UPI0014279D3F|nr:toxin-antitoxin system HicB family antitoxin [Tolypothrix sp. PCC 7910]QIR36832.1 toxin-antitoxin system HicB family antitoxin [Tolypothrix sp. PCC 7910]
MTLIANYVKRYSYLVEYSTEDEAYLARCVELGIVAHGETQEEALAAIKTATKVHLQMLKEDSEPLPEPLSLQRFSGKLNLRMSPEKHREIVLRAKALGVSINYYINSRL